MSAGQEHGPERGRLGSLPRPLALALLVAWALLTIVALVRVVAGPSPWSGETEALLPVQDRTPSGRTLVLLRVDLDAVAELDDADAQTDPQVILAEASFAIEEALAGERVPLAPPRTEITRWLDAHALYLLAIETHAALAERLSDAQMLAQVQGLHARLSSPLFAVSGEQPRRDPLGVHELTRREAGRLGHVAEVPGSDAPQVSASGDLIAAGGDRALIGLVSDRSLAELRADLDAALDSMPVTAALIDPRAHAAEVEAQLADDWTAVVVGCLAALIVLLAIVMRRVIPVVGVAVCLASAWLLLTWAAVGLELELGGVGLGLGGIDLASLAVSVMLIGFGCDAALRLPKIGPRGWTATLVMAAAFVPLWLSPYPLWQRWALWWPIAYLVLAGIMRAILPALLELTRSDFEWRRPGFRLAPMPVLAVLLCLGLSGAGIWFGSQLDYRPPGRVPLAEIEQRALEAELREHFFDPSMIVEARSRPADPNQRAPELETEAAAALDAAAETAARLAELVPGEARRVDSPGSFVLPADELEVRRQALAKLQLDGRMEVLEGLLSDRGLRAEAFAEFVRGAADIDDLPSAQAALDGPLGPWIAGYLIEREGGEGSTVELRTWVELRGREGLPTVPLPDQRLAELPALRGPAIAATIDAQAFDQRLGLAVLAGLWLTCFFVWLGTGRLAIALAVGFVALSCEAGVLLGLHLLDQPSGPHLLPVLLLVGAAAGVAGGRACRAVSLGQPVVARGLLLLGACQVVAGGVLLTSGQPLWRELGLAVALGSALACGLGPFATPGLAAWLERRRRASAPDRAEPAKEDPGD